MKSLARLILGGLCFGAIITASADEENKEITDALRRASDVVLKAHKASDLDAALIELHRLATVAVRFRSGNPERESAVNRLYDAARFLQQWQNYLWAVEGEKFDNRNQNTHRSGAKHPKSAGCSALGNSRAGAFAGSQRRGTGGQLRRAHSAKYPFTGRSSQSTDATEIAPGL